jgi:hypothetical protein
MRKLLVGTPLLLAFAIVAFFAWPDNTKSALREFGFEGHWAADCSKAPDWRQGPAGSHFWNHVPWFGSATRVLDQGTVKATFIILDARMVADGKLFLVTKQRSDAPDPSPRPDIARFDGVTESVLIMRNGRIQTADSQFKGVVVNAGKDPFDGRMHSKGDSYDRTSVKDGWTYIAGERAGIAPLLEKCRE